MWRLLNVICAAAASLALAGCGQPSPPASARPPGQQQAEEPGRHPRDDVVLLGTAGFPRNERIIRVNGDGSGWEDLASGGDPARSPDGRQVVFVAGTGDAAGLYVMNDDGSARRMIANNTGWPEQPWFAPRWSPDGKRIAFCALVYGPGAGRGAGPSASRLYTVDADGSNLKQVGTVMGLNPAWSRDGIQLLFTRWDERGMSLCVVDLDGTNERELVGGGASMGAWAPDGGTLAYVIQSGTAAGLYVTKADGSQSKRLAGGPDEVTLAPQWSHDGRRLYFTWMAEGELEYSPGPGPDGKIDPFANVEMSETAPSAVHVIDVDGRNLRRVTQGDSMEYTGGAGFFSGMLGPGEPSAPRRLPTTSWGPDPAPILVDEQAAAEWVDSIGGSVERDEEQPGQPIYLVDLSGTRVTDEDLKNLSGLKSLSIVYVNGTKVTDSGLKHLARHKKLSQMNLNATEVTDTGLKELAACKSLVVLVLESTNVTDAGVAELREVLPNCEIFR